MVMLQEVAVFAGRCDAGCVRAESARRARRFFGAGDDRQRFVFDFDQLQRFGGDGFRFGSHQRDPIAHIAHLVVTKHRPIDFVHAAIFASWYVVGSQAQQPRPATLSPCSRPRSTSRACGYGCARRARATFHRHTNHRRRCLCRSTFSTASGRGSGRLMALQRLFDGRQRRDVLTGRLLHSADDGVVAGAAADVPFVPVVNFFERGVEGSYRAAPWSP